MRDIECKVCDPGSFRDPSGFVFKVDEILYRQINKCYKEDYLQLQNSGLYRELVEKDFLVKHKEDDDSSLLSGEGYLIIMPEQIDFISYPYEWCFDQLKDAALLTLKIQKLALNKGMTLKDASAYNVQFHNGKPIFIDTLSFEVYNQNTPWGAYRQFCQHFLAPLVLMKHIDVRLNSMLRTYIDGIPLDIASKMLSWKTRLNFSSLMHIHLHANMQTKYASKGEKQKDAGLSKGKLIALISGLESTISGLNPSKQNTEWEKYYSFTNYSESGAQHKANLIDGYLDIIKPKNLWDIGANDGTFTKIAYSRGIKSVAFDIDPLAVNNHYKNLKESNEANALPLILDMTNPSPGLGWASTERASVTKRSGVDLIMALAIIHHLAISNNVPLDQIAQLMSNWGKALIIEFVPKGDSQVDLLLLSRKDIFTEYDQPTFEKVFSNYFEIIESKQIEGSTRVLYLMKTL